MDPKNIYSASRGLEREVMSIDAIQEATGIGTGFLACPIRPHLNEHKGFRLNVTRKREEVKKESLVRAGIASKQSVCVEAYIWFAGGRDRSGGRRCYTVVCRKGGLSSNLVDLHTFTVVVGNSGDSGSDFSAVGCHNCWCKVAGSLSTERAKSE